MSSIIHDANIAECKFPQYVNSLRFYEKVNADSIHLMPAAIVVEEKFNIFRKEGLGKLFWYQI